MCSWSYPIAFSFDKLWGSFGTKGVFLHWTLYILQLHFIDETPYEKQDYHDLHFFRIVHVLPNSYADHILFPFKLKKSNYNMYFHV